MIWLEYLELIFFNKPHQGKIFHYELASAIITILDDDGFADRLIGVDSHLRQVSDESFSNVFGRDWWHTQAGNEGKTPAIERTWKRRSLPCWHIRASPQSLGSLFFGNSKGSD